MDLDLVAKGEEC
jgi:hypothetical protein